MKLTVLASGSKANSVILQTPACNIMIDAGLSAAQLNARLQAARIDPRSISACLLTHEHNDHTAGLVSFCKPLGIMIYANAMTAQAIEQAAMPWNIFTTGKRFKLFDCIVETYPVNHDACEPVGFLFVSQKPGEWEKAFAYATDLGLPTREMIDVCDRATTLFVEANYDEELIKEDKTRPWSVKERIMSPNGHLSNQQAGLLVAGLPNLRKVILGHLSSNTNHPVIAQTAIREAIAGDASLKIEVAHTPDSERHLPPRTYTIE